MNFEELAEAMEKFANTIAEAAKTFEQIASQNIEWETLLDLLDEDLIKERAKMWLPVSPTYLAFAELENWRDVSFVIEQPECPETPTTKKSKPRPADVFQLTENTFFVQSAVDRQQGYQIKRVLVELDKRDYSIPLKVMRFVCECPYFRRVEQTDRPYCKHIWAVSEYAIADKNELLWLLVLSPQQALQVFLKTRPRFSPDIAQEQTQELLYLIPELKEYLIDAE